MKNDWSRLTFYPNHGHGNARRHAHRQAMIARLNGIPSESVVDVSAKNGQGRAAAYAKSHGVDVVFFSAPRARTRGAMIRGTMYLNANLTEDQQLLAVATHELLDPNDEVFGVMCLAHVQAILGEYHLVGEECDLADLKQWHAAPISVRATITDPAMDRGGAA